jgi:hypothetical protein
VSIARLNFLAVAKFGRKNFLCGQLATLKGREKGKSLFHYHQISPTANQIIKSFYQHLRTCSRYFDLEDFATFLFSVARVWFESFPTCLTSPSDVGHSK